MLRTMGKESVVISQQSTATKSDGAGRVEACPFAGIIQIKFNGNFSERIMPKQSSNTRHAHTYNLRPQLSSSQVPKNVHPTEPKNEILPQSFNERVASEMAVRLRADICSDYLLVSVSGLNPFSVSRTSSSVDADASLRSIRLWNQTDLDLRHHSSMPMTVMPDMMTIA